MAKEHDLKVWPLYFAALRKGNKTFEVRKDDRGGFHAGDTLMLREWQPMPTDAEPDAGHYTQSAPLYREISYVMEGGKFGIEPGYVVLGIQRPR